MPQEGRKPLVACEVHTTRSNLRQLGRKDDCGGSTAPPVNRVKRGAIMNAFRSRGCTAGIVALITTLASAQTSVSSPRDKAFFAVPAVVNFVRPGLVLKIESVNIASDGTILAQFKLTDSIFSTRPGRSEEHTSELQSPDHLVCRLLLAKKNLRSLAALTPSAP